MKFTSAEYSNAWAMLVASEDANRPLLLKMLKRKPRSDWEAMLVDAAKIMEARDHVDLKSLPTIDAKRVKLFSVESDVSVDEARLHLEQLLPVVIAVRKDAFTLEQVFDLARFAAAIVSLARREGACHE